MAKFDWAKLQTSEGSGDEGGGDGRRTVRPSIPPRPGAVRIIAAVILGLVVVYGAYFWMIRRVVVPPGKVLVLLRKDGGRSLEGDQIIIPRAPDAKLDSTGYDKWDQKYGDANGLLEQVYPEGTYFGFSPFDYEREIFEAVVVPNGKVGVIVKKFGDKLDAGQVMADPARNQRGPMAMVLQPARYNEYSNPYAYEVKLVDPVQVDPGHRGVVTILAAGPAKDPNQYLVNEGEQGMQRTTEPEGFRYINPYVKRVMPISITSQRFEMTGNDAIQFPSSDSFDIKMEGFVEWSVIPDKLALLYVQYGSGGELIPYLDDKVILPYARSFSRLVGSQYRARDFISGDTKLKFQHEFESKLREACEKQGIEVLQALVRDIIPPDDIKNPINEREVAKQQILTIEQQIQVAKSAADLATQTEMANQNQKIGEANKQVVTIIKKSQQEKDVAVTKAKQDLAVAELHLDAARNQADALVARGQADANVILLKKQAEADPLRQQVSAFGDGNAYAQYFFFQKIAPSVKSILTNTDGPFADLFRQFMKQSPDKATAQKGNRREALSSTQHATNNEQSMNRIKTILKGSIAALILFYGLWLVFKWTAMRVYVGQGEALIVINKFGTALPPDRIVVPKGDNSFKGVQEDVRGPGRYFLNPIEYDWEKIALVEIPAGDPQKWAWNDDGTLKNPQTAPKIGVISAKQGKSPDSAAAVVNAGEKGIQRDVLTPGTYKLNKYLFDWKLEPAVIVPPGSVGVVTRLTGDVGEVISATLTQIRASTTGPATQPGQGADPSAPTRLVVGANQRGILKEVLQPGIYYLNPRMMKVSIVPVGYDQITLDHSKNTGIRFYSFDGYLVEADFTVVWGRAPADAPHIVANIGSAQKVEQNVIEPAMKAACQNEGAKYTAKELIQGTTRSRFQDDLSKSLEDQVKSRNIHVLLALIRNINIKDNTGKDQTQGLLATIQQANIEVERDLTNKQKTETAMNRAQLEQALKLVDVAKETVASDSNVKVANIMADGTKQAAEISAQRELEVAKIELEISKLDAQRNQILGKADADVTRLKAEAEAKGAKMLVDALGSPQAYNNYIFARSFEPQELRLIFAGPGTFWTDLKNFQEVGASKIIQQSQTTEPQK